MKIRIFSILIGFLLVLINFSHAQAQTMSLDKSAGTTRDSYVVTGSNFSPLTRHIIRAYNSSDVSKQNAITAWTIYTDDKGNFRQVVGPFDNSVSIDITEGLIGNPIGNTLSVEISGSFVPLACGDSCQSNSNRCPANCPCINVSGSTWSCGGGQAPVNIQNVDCIKTALGICVNIKGDTNDFVAQILKFGIGIAGGIAFLLMLFATFQIMTSAGNPDKLKGGKELLTSAIAGLLLIIFSVFLLQLIGVEILDLPGFGLQGPSNSSSTNHIPL